MTTSIMFTATNTKVVSVEDMKEYLFLKGLFCTYFMGGLSKSGAVNCAKLAIEHVSTYHALRNAMPEWEKEFSQIEREVLDTVEALSK